MNNKVISIISFTRTANNLNVMVQEKMKKHYNCSGYTVRRFAGEQGLHVIEDDLKNWVGKQWGQMTFLFIGAAGIAIRSIAPWIKDKYSDSAVIVMDEKGQYIIPLLAGHIGGAVAIAYDIAECLDGVAVITTATDVQNVFAVDSFAGNNKLCITDRTLAKSISAAVLEGVPVGFYSSWPIHGVVPSGLIQCKSLDELKKYASSFAVMKDSYLLWPQVLHLKPESPGGIVVGIGCRKGTESQRLETALERVLKNCGLRKVDVQCFVSIDLKKEEAGIKTLASLYDAPFYTYSADELKNVKTVSSGSSFVESVTGVDNVCERAVDFHCPEGTMILQKTVVDGIAFALKEEDVKLFFDDDKRIGLEDEYRILIFAGTTEGRDLVEFLSQYKVELYISVATAYGKEIWKSQERVVILDGRMNADEMKSLIDRKKIQLVVDATHPFAREVTVNIRDACYRADVEYIRCLRDEPETENNLNDSVISVSSISEAVEWLSRTDEKILITTGSKELWQYTKIDNYQERCFVLVLPLTESLDICRKEGYQGNHIIAMQGPFSKEMNVAMIHFSQAKYMVTKESGATGGMAEKVQACKETGITLVVIRRPTEEGMNMKAVRHYLSEKLEDKRYER